MTIDELQSVIKLITDCDAYLDGRAHSTWIANIAEDAAKRAVEERKQSLYERLRNAGLNLVEAEA